MDIYTKPVTPSTIISAKEFFKIDDNLALVRIDDDPNAIDGVNDFIVSCCKQGITFKNFDGAVFVPVEHLFTTNSMDYDSAVSIINSYIKHLQDTIAKLKK